ALGRMMHPHPSLRGTHCSGHPLLFNCNGSPAMGREGEGQGGGRVAMAEDLQVGGKAPDFSLPDQDSKMVSLKSLKGKQVVLYFYPKDDTPGCTKEACGFRDSWSAIEKANTVVLGVSMDDAESHQKFIKKYSLPFTLLCDEDGTVSKAYGVYKKKNM